MIPPRVGYEIEPGLIEEAVVLIRRSTPQHAFWQERALIYETPDPEERDRLFIQLHARENEVLQLTAPLLQAILEQPFIVSRVKVCRVLRAKTFRDEGAELFVATNDSQTSSAVLVRLRPSTVVNPELQLTLLRHEMQHIADMLDPNFKYDPTPDVLDLEPARTRLVLDRYRTLWDTTIDGRLLRRSHAAPQARALREGQFHAAFGGLKERCAAEFERWFLEERPTHPEMLRFASDPVAATSETGQRSESSGICPLCRCPSTVTRMPPGERGALVAQEARRDFPHWTPADGLCPQCFELYAARPLSRAALETLPRASRASTGV